MCAGGLAALRQLGRGCSFASADRVGKLMTAALVRGAGSCVLERCRFDRQAKERRVINSVCVVFWFFDLAHASQALTPLSALSTRCSSSNT